MTTRNVTSTHLQNLLNSSNGLVVGTPGTQVRVYQRTVTPPALPSISNAVSNDGSFFNLQQTHPNNFISSGSGAAGTPTLTNTGLNIGPNDTLGVSLSTTNSWCRAGTWWSEGIMSFIPGAGTIQYLDRDIAQGFLRLRKTGSTWRFEFINNSNNFHIFSSINVPLTSSAPESIPQFFYYRFLKEIPTTGTGAVHMVVNDGSTTQTQTINGVAQPLNASPSGTSLGLSNGSTINMFWHRGLGSDTRPTVGALQSTYWTTPAVFGNDTYTSNGTAGVVDAQANDEYWHNLGVVQGGQFTGLSANGGATLEARVAATNTAPTGDTSTLFSGNFFPLQNIPVSLSDPQGRYLALQLKYTPGSEWPLSSGSVIIAQDSNVMMTASHFPDPSGNVVISLPVPGEGATQGTLPYRPETISSQSSAVIRSTMDFEFPYTVARPLATGSRRSYAVTWVLTESERDTLVAFFESRDGSGTFTWTAPGDSTTSLAALNSPITISQQNPGAYVIQATLVEVL